MLYDLVLHYINRTITLYYSMVYDITSYYIALDYDQYNPRGMYQAWQK